MSAKPIDSELVGDAWPDAMPAEEPVLYGHVELQPQGAFEVRSLQTFRLVYTVGRYGIDDTGSIRVVFRHVGDWGSLQSTDPTGYNYVSAAAQGTLELTCNHGEVTRALREIGLQDIVLEAGGLERRLRVFRLPAQNPHRELTATVPVELRAQGDNPLWICVTTEDGFQAWSSPIFAFRH